MSICLLLLICSLHRCSCSCPVCARCSCPCLPVARAPVCPLLVPRRLPVAHAPDCPLLVPPCAGCSCRAAVLLDMFPGWMVQTFFVVSEEEIQAELLPECPASFSLLQSQCLFPEPAERCVGSFGSGVFVVTCLFICPLFVCLFVYLVMYLFTYFLCLIILGTYGLLIVRVCTLFRSSYSWVRWKDEAPTKLMQKKKSKKVSCPY